MLLFLKYLLYWSAGSAVYAFMISGAGTPAFLNELPYSAAMVGLVVGMCYIATITGAWDLPSSGGGYYNNDSEDDEGMVVNPATGNFMVGGRGGVDTDGHPYGCM